VAEINAIDPVALLVKGDLTSRGTVEEYQQFLDTYAGFGDYQQRADREIPLIVLEPR